jgi:hypothetical protein
MPELGKNLISSESGITAIEAVLDMKFQKG